MKTLLTETTQKCVTTKTECSSSQYTVKESVTTFVRIMERRCAIVELVAAEPEHVKLEQPDNDISANKNTLAEALLAAWTPAPCDDGAAPSELDEKIVFADFQGRFDELCAENAENQLILCTTLTELCQTYGISCGGEAGDVSKFKFDPFLAELISQLYPCQLLVLKQTTFHRSAESYD